MRVFVNRVIDGDTIEATFKKQILDSELKNTVNYRLYGIDAPEKTGATKEAGLASMTYLQQRIEGQKVKLKLYGKDKYGRWLATVYLDGVNINAELVEQGHAIYRTY